MSVETDADRAMMLMDFATPVTLPTGEVVQAFLDVDAQQLDVFSGATLVDREPMLFGRTMDLRDLRQKQILVIEGANWEVVEPQTKADGAFTEIRLRKAS